MSRCRHAVSGFLRRCSGVQWQEGCDVIFIEGGATLGSFFTASAATSAIAASSVSSTISMCFFELAHNLNRLLFICRMKSLLRIINCMLLITVSTNICSSRTVLSESTGKPVIYASIGVINRNLGTVTDSLGNFSLKIPAEYINDSIRISSIGHVAKIFAVKDIKNIPDTIFLAMMRLCLMKS